MTSNTNKNKTNNIWRWKVDEMKNYLTLKFNNEMKTFPWIFAWPYGKIIAPQKFKMDTQNAGPWKRELVLKKKHDNLGISILNNFRGVLTFTFQYVGLVYTIRCLSRKNFEPIDLRPNCGSVIESVLPPFHHNFLKAKMFCPS